MLGPHVRRVGDGFIAAFLFGSEHGCNRGRRQMFRNNPALFALHHRSSDCLQHRTRAHFKFPQDFALGGN
jgi:hypothetical protein